MLLTFNEPTMRFVGCIAKSLDRAFRNNPVIADLKLEFSMCNLRVWSVIVTVCGKQNTSNSVQKGEVVE
jgi:hypothetical protein